jgi:DNA-binding response OmpR family regulator
MQDGKHVILCVDDDPDILSFLQIVLEAEGYAFVGAASAEEGLGLFKQIRPDLLIVDLMMEEVDAGTNFAKELRLLHNEAPIYMLSSVGDNLNITADYTALGLSGVFQKPLSKDTLLAVLRVALPESSPVG